MTRKVSVLLTRWPVLVGSLPTPWHRRPSVFVVRGVPDGPQLGVAAELEMFRVFVGGYIKDRKVPLGEED